MQLEWPKIQLLLCEFDARHGVRMVDVGRSSGWQMLLGTFRGRSETQPKLSTSGQVDMFCLQSERQKGLLSVEVEEEENGSVCSGSTIS